MQRSQKEQQTHLALRQLLLDLDVGEEQFKRVLTSIGQIVHSEQIREQLPEPMNLSQNQQNIFVPPLAFSSHNQEGKPPPFQPTSSTAFRTELLARFCLVMFDQADPEKYL